MNGCSFSAINTAKAALQTLVTINGRNNWGQDKDIVRLIKGVYSLKPPTPKYSHTWNADQVVEYIQLLIPHEKLTFKEITLKTLGLIALTSGSRVQSIHLLDIDNMEKTNEIFRFKIKKRIKTTKPGQAQPIMVMRKFSNPSCCPYTALEEYFKRTAEIRTTTKLWISLTKPHKPVGKQTLSRWLKELLKLSGIDTSQFTAHSTRMAASSKVNAMGVGIDTILRTAGWSSATNFTKFYRRETQIEENRRFAEAVLAQRD